MVTLNGLAFWANPVTAINNRHVVNNERKVHYGRAANEQSILAISALLANETYGRKRVD